MERIEKSPVECRLINGKSVHKIELQRDEIASRLENFYVRINMPNNVRSGLEFFSIDGKPLEFDLIGWDSHGEAILSILLPVLDPTTGEGCEFYVSYYSE